ncbi:HAD-IIIA family hydrolase [Glycomyces albidus]|uniref:D,D-heptose 1,7-bisphosphate phosphatase n=1 Tax=Glycomyces albidus TaxID=2656774 RepID=A0A6L5G7P6_9ACTN|nr:HAD-IIIA family hydrolase [Glycomyces albidus]MQM25633.1 HAD-IIIA family hydrolase [Glycomyces albidus]
MSAVTVVVPTVGRASLETLLSALAAAEGPPPERVVLVDDRPEPGPLRVPDLPFPHVVLRSGGRGPAAARNTGWRAADTEWVAFLDDDVVPGADWFARLHADLKDLGEQDAGSQGCIEVPVPVDRRPTDAERRTLALEHARWITADMAYRRSALEAVGGFDERFKRAFREDTDLALRIVDSGLRIAEGRRRSRHPVRPGGFLSSVRDQIGNADNALMRAKHGATWRRRAGEQRSRFPGHLTTTALGVAALAGAIGRRITPGPRNAGEIADLAVSSALIPPVAVAWNVIGTIRHRPAPPVEAVLFDRDDTLIKNIPALADPDLVEPMPGALAATARLRALQIPIGVVTNQSAIAKGLLDEAALEAVNERVDKLLGPFGAWEVCPHRAEDCCACRKPSPAMVARAAARLGARPERCVMIGDIGADVEAALAAGARAILVPTERTRPEEIAAARRRAAVARDLAEAVNLALGAIA